MAAAVPTSTVIRSDVIGHGGAILDDGLGYGLGVRGLGYGLGGHGLVGPSVLNVGPIGVRSAYASSIAHPSVHGGLVRTVAAPALLSHGGLVGRSWGPSVLSGHGGLIGGPSVLVGSGLGHGLVGPSVLSSGYGYGAPLVSGKGIW